MSAETVKADVLDLMENGGGQIEITEEDLERADPFALRELEAALLAEAARAGYELNVEHIPWRGVVRIRWRLAR